MDVGPVEDPSTEREHVERMFARGLVVAGGIFWGVAAFAGPFVYQDAGLASALGTAVWPFAAALVILVIARLYERLAAELLFAAAAAVPVWGVVYGWELGLWIIMVIVLMVPMTLSAVLFLLASSAEERRRAAAEKREREAAAASRGLVAARR